MAADGSIIIDTRIDTSGMESGANDIGNIFSRMTNAAKKFGVAIGAAFAVKQIINFGQECLDLGSDLQEVQNVVDSVFTTMSDKVDEFAKSAASTAGLSETMAKQYSGTFGAMAKAFGFAESEAYDMATSLTQLSGDVASFYNLSQDEAYTKLKSVFTGETESLKDLGVVMTQTALDSYAMANGFGKTTSAMTEQEKVALRYQFVMSQLSTASGDFLRTSDGWANQVKVLQLQIQSLKATIGQGLINIFTPVIKVINIVLSKLAVVANAFKAFTELITGSKSTSTTNTGVVTEELSTGYETAADSANDYADATDNATDSMKKAAKAAKSYLSPIDEINKYTSQTDTSTGTTGTTGTSSALTPSIDYGQLAEGETVIDEVNNKFEDLFNTLKESLAPLTEQLKVFGSIAKGAFTWLLENVLTPLANFTITEVVPRFFQTLGNMLAIVNNVLLALQPLWQWFWTNVLQPIISWTGGIFLQVWDGINTALKAFADWCANNPGIIQTAAIVIGSFIAAWGIVNIATKIMGIVNSVGSFIGVLQTLGTVMGKGPAWSAILGAALKALSSPVGIAVAVIGTLIAAGVLIWKNWDTIKEKATEIWDAISTYLSHLWETIKTNAVNDFNAIKTGIQNIWNGIKLFATTVWNGISTFLSNLWTAIKTTASTKWEEFKTTVTGVWTTVKSKATEVFDGIATKISDVWTGVKTTAKEKWDGIKETILDVVEKIRNKVKTAFEKVKTAISGAFEIAKSPINGLIDAFNVVVNVINSLINKINSIKFKITVPDWVPGIGGSWWGFDGFNIPTVNKIPYLATGAVIPPNAPFLAVLGDQKNGNNIEAPEALIRKIMREELGNQRGTSGNTYKVEATCGRRTIFEIVIEEGKLQQTATGKNPFSLA